MLGPDPTATFFGEVYVNHRDHRETGWALLDAVAPAAAMPLYFPEQGPPHQVSVLLLSGTHEPDVVVDVSRTIDIKVKAVLRARLPSGRRRRGHSRRRPGTRRTGRAPHWRGLRRSISLCRTRLLRLRRSTTRRSFTSTWTPSSPRSRCSTIRHCAASPSRLAIRRVKHAKLPTRALSLPVSHDLNFASLQAAPTITCSSLICTPEESRAAMRSSRLSAPA